MQKTSSPSNVEKAIADKIKKDDPVVELAVDLVGDLIEDQIKKGKH